MKCDAVVLAAGYSSRAGTNKMTLTIDNKAILERVIETLLAVCDKIIVVGGHNYNSIKLITNKYKNVKLIENTKYHLGMFSSVKCGVREMTGDFFLIPGDYPLVKQTTYKALLEGKGDFIVPEYKGRRGHPVLIKKNLIKPINKEPMESNLKLFRDKCNTEFIQTDDEGILIDLDTMEDFENIKRIIGRRNQIEN